MKTNIYIYDQFFLESEMFRIKVHTVKTHFTFNNFFPENCVVYEKMWKNMAEPDRSQMAKYCPFTVTVVT